MLTSFQKLFFFYLLVISGFSFGQYDVPAPVQKEIDALQQWMQAELAASNELDTAKLNSWNRKIQALQLEHKAEQKKMYANPTTAGGIRIQKNVSGGSSLVVPEGKIWTIEQVTLGLMDIF